MGCNWFASLRQLLVQRDVRQLLFYLTLNWSFMFIEIVYGIQTNSLGLVSDAVHMLFDCLAVAVALVASVVSAWPATDNFTYGFARVEVLAGFVNGVLLLFTSFGILVSSIERMLEPAEIEHPGTLFVVACLGFCVNAVGLLLFHEHAHIHAHGGGDMGCGDNSCTTDHGAEKTSGGEVKSAGSANMRGMFLHILGDTLGSAGVVVSSLVVRYFNWTFFDTIISVAISTMLFVLVWPLIQSTALVLLQRQPSWMDTPLQAALNDVLWTDDVRGLRSARFWCVTPKNIEGSVCISVSSTLPGARAEIVRHLVETHFISRGVERVAVQLDYDAETEEPSPAFDNRLSYSDVGRQNLGVVPGEICPPPPMPLDGETCPPPPMPRMSRRSGKDV